MSKTTTFKQSVDGDEYRPVGLVAEIESPQDIVRLAAMRIEPPYNKKERLLISQVKTSKTLDDASKKSLLPLVEVFVPTDPSTGKQMKPLAQLNDSRLGSTEFSERCKTCRVNNADCPTHKAFVQLPHPICPSPFVPFVRRSLVSICYFCSELLTSSLSEKLPPVNYCNELAPLSLVQLDQWKQGRQAIFHSATAHMLAYSTNAGLSQPAPQCHHCGMPQPIYIAAGCHINAKWPPPSADETYSDVNWKPSEKAMKKFVLALHRSFALRGGIDTTEFVARVGNANDDDDDVCAMRDMIQAMYLSQQDELDQQIPPELLPCRSADALITNLLQIPVGRETKEERWALRAMTLISAPMRNKLFQSTFTSSDAYHILSGLSHATSWRMGYNPVTNHQKFMIFTHLPIAGKGARPATTESTGSSLKSENSLTTQYRDVLKHVSLLRSKLSMLAVDCAVSLSADSGGGGGGSTKREALRGSRNVITGEIIGAEDQTLAIQDDDNLTSDDAFFNFSNATDRRMPAMPMWMRCQDARSIMQFTLDSEATQHLSNLALKISSMIDSKASAKKAGGHNSGKTGAKNSANTQNDTKNVLESMRMAAAAENDGGDLPPPTAEKSAPKQKAKRRSKDLPPTEPAKSTLTTAERHRHHTSSCACREFYQSLVNFRPNKTARTLNEEDENDSLPLFEHSISMVSAALSSVCTSGAQANAVAVVEKRGFANPSPHIPAYGKQATSKPLDKILNGKHARIRGHLLSKRGDGTDRCVLSTCANIPVDAVGTPYASCKIQTIPHRVTRANIAALKECIRIGSGALDGASKIVTCENKIIYIPKRTKKLETDPFLKIGWTVHVHIRHGDTVILNRQPSLHRGNHNSRKTMRTAGKTDQVNENSVTRFNGDADGDEVNKQFSQSIEARADEIMCMGIAYNLVNPRTASLFTSLHENTLLGAFLLSEGSTFLTKEQASLIIGAIRMITKKRRDATTYHGFVKDEKYRYRKNVVDSDAYVPMANDLPQLKPDAPSPGWSLPEPCILKPTPLWSGKQIMAVLLPADLAYSAATLEMDYTDGIERGSRQENDEAFERALLKDKHARLVCITADYWLAGDGNQDIFGGSQTSIIKHIWQHYGQQYACDLISDWCVMVHEYLKIRGFSVGAADFMLAGVPSPTRLADWMQQQALEKARQQSQPITSDKAKETATRRRQPSVEIEFHKHALRQKERMVKALNAAYDEVRAFIISPEIMTYLTRSDIDSARRRVEAYINDVAPRYITAMTLSFSDSRRNGASLMATSGAKGSVGNSSEMETCFGARNINGVLIGSNMSHPRSRNFVHEYPGEFSASSSGFVASSLSSGLTEVEMMQHTMPARHGIYKSSDPKVSGYQQRRMSALAENQTVRYDRTVRDGQQIVQILFGGDGIESILIQRVHIGPTVLNARPLLVAHDEYVGDALVACIGSLAANLLAGDSTQTQDPNVHCFARVQAFDDGCLVRRRMIETVARAMRDIDRAVNRCSTSADHTCEACTNETDAIRRLADNLVASTACRPYAKMASAKTIKEKRGIAAYLPINMREVMTTHAARWRRETSNAHQARAEEFVDNFLQCGLYSSSISTSSPIPVVDSLCDALYAEYATGGNSPSSSLLSNAVKHASTKPVASHAELLKHVEDLCNALCDRMGPSAMPIDLILSVRHALRFNSSLYDVAHASRWHLKCLMQDIYDICSQSTVDGGEPVGIVMCQSISEPTTQLIMRLFKPEFAGASHTQGGITRQDEILNNTKTSVPSIYCALSPQWVSSMEDAKFVRDQMVGKKLSHWMDADFAVWMNMTKPTVTTGNRPHLTSDAEMTPSHALFASIWSAVRQSYADVAVAKSKEETLAKETGQGNAKKRKRTSSPTEDLTDVDDKHAKSTGGKESTMAAPVIATTPERQGILLFKFYDDNVRDGFFADSDGTSGGPHVDDHTSSQRWRSKRVMSRLLSRVLLPWQRGCIIGGPSVHPLCPYYWVVWPLHGVQDCSTWLRLPTSATQTDDAWNAYMIGMHQLSKTMRSDLLVVGNEGIQECVSISSPTVNPTNGGDKEGGESVETPEMCYILHLRGSDFPSVLSHPATFDQYCYTSDLRMVEEIFDLESRAQHTVHELSQVYDSGNGNNKIFILPRQFQLLADTTTASAEVTAVNRYGLENKLSFASVLCFERTSSKIVESCVAGRFDPMDDVSPNSMFGARTETIGTSIVEIIPTPRSRRAQRATRAQTSTAPNPTRVRASVGNENDEDLLALVSHVCKIRVS